MTPTTSRSDRVAAVGPRKSPLRTAAMTGAELAAARVAGAGPLLRASATAIPLRDVSVDVVTCSMSLMVFSPLPQVLAETARVLRPGGRLVATIPACGQ
jgi:SAM-dependent methyltransferase